MKSSGNGSVDVCVNNLLRMVRGEVPYERTKGIDPRLIDMPQRGSSTDLAADAEWVLEIFEPRAVLDGLKVVQKDGANGDFSIVANVTERE